MSGRFKRAVAGVVACALVGGVALLVAEPGASAAQSDGWASGVYPGPCKNTSQNDRIAYAQELTDFGTWRKHPVQTTMQFAPYDSTSNWLTTEEPNSLFKCAIYLRQTTHVPMIFVMPMLPNHDTDDITNKTAPAPTLAAGAAGAYNQYWQQLAQNLVSRGLSDTVLRIGWEFNGDWFNWSAVKDPASWTKYWQNIVTTMRKVPGSHFTFDYAIALGSTRVNPGTTISGDPVAVYPGDGYVDIISASIYDQWFGQPACNTVGLPVGCKSNSARWANLLNQKYGLAWMSDFAARHKKPIGLSEWALADTGSFCEAGKCGGGGDDSYFITKLHDYLANPPVVKRSPATTPTKTAYEIYFDKDHDTNTQAMTDGFGNDGPNFPGAQRTYKAAWTVTSGHSPSSSVLPSTGFPSTSAPTSSAPSSSPPSSSPPPSSSSPSPTPSTTPPPVLPKNTPLFSKYSSRAKAKKLSKQKVSGYIYVFVKPSKTVSYAAWYLDDSKRKKKAYRMVRLTPYDLVGYKGRLALPFHVGHVKKGKHTLSVLLRWKTGGYKVYTVTFTR